MADGTFTKVYPNENLVYNAIAIEKNYIGSVGELVVSNNNFSTDYIGASPGDIFSSTQPYEGAGYGRLAEYDSNKIFIRRQLLQRASSGSGELQFAPVGSTTAFIRWSADSSGVPIKQVSNYKKGLNQYYTRPALKMITKMPIQNTKDSIQIRIKLGLIILTITNHGHHSWDHKEKTVIHR